MKPGSSKSSLDKEGENQRVLDNAETTTTPIVAGALPHLLWPEGRMRLAFLPILNICIP